MHPARLQGRALVHPEAEAELGFEQDPRAEAPARLGRVDPKRTGVDGKPDPRPKVNVAADLPAKSRRRIMDVVRAVQSDEGVGRGRADRAQSAEPLAPIAELKIDSALDPAKIERSLDVMGVEASNHLLGQDGRAGAKRGQGGGRSKQGPGLHVAYPLAVNAFGGTRIALFRFMPS